MSKVCEECGYQMDDNALECPNCGCPIENEKAYMNVDNSITNQERKGTNIASQIENATKKQKNAEKSQHGTGVFQLRVFGVIVVVLIGIILSVLGGLRIANFSSHSYEYVDLGLSVKWATCNVGASSPEEFGDYYAWGETVTKSAYSWSTYKWCNGSKDTQAKYCTKSNYGTVDHKMELDASDDVAQVKWGGSWRMPTDEEMTELRENSTWTWTTQNGRKGYKVTGPNGNSIFLPAAGGRSDSWLNGAGSYGDYWSSSLFVGGPSRACSVYFDSSDVDGSYDDRYYGRSVRPVWSESSSTTRKVVTSITLDKSSLSLMEGDDYTLTATVNPSNASDKSLRWSSSNSSVAIVSASGKVSAIQAGTATIMAIANDGSGVETTCSVTVTANHEYVDLGLSVKWATYNVGASSPEEYGDYYAWGETETKNTYNWSTYKWCEGSETTLAKYCTSSSYGTVDNKKVLESSDDVAHVKWGGRWRMPTGAEMRELLRNCILEWTIQNGKNGLKATSKMNGNSIFLPAAGFRDGSSLSRAEIGSMYWSSSLSLSAGTIVACFVGISPRDVNWYDGQRYYGGTVRPVCP